MLTKTFMIMGPQAVLIPLFGVALSAILLWLGRRGKRIDDHPACRRCGFDLFGMPPTSQHCPECGQSISGPRAIRIGNRRHRSKLLLSGALLLLLSLASFYLLERGALSQFRLIRYEPAWWLIRQTASKNAKTRDQAMAELIDRIDAGTLAEPKVDHLVGLALDYQRQSDLPWISGWGEIIEHARKVEKVSDAQWQQYILQAVSATFTVRPRIRRGDPLASSIQLSPPRLGRTAFRAELPMERQIELSSMGKPDYRVPIGGPGGGFYRFGLGKGASFTNWPSAYTDARVWDTLPDGPLVARCRTELIIYVPQDIRPKKKWIAPVKKEFDMSAPFVLTARNQPTVTLRSDPQGREAMRQWAASAICPNVEFAGASTGLSSEWNPPPPLDCAFRLYVKTRDDEYFGCEVCYRANQPEPVRHGLLYAYDGSDHVDLILRPCAACAAKTMDMTAIWGEEVVFHNVAVKPLQ